MQGGNTAKIETELSWKGWAWSLTKKTGRLLLDAAGTMLTYDMSQSIPACAAAAILMPRVGDETAEDAQAGAALFSITLNLVGYLLFSTVVQTAFDHGEQFGKLNQPLTNTQEGSVGDERGLLEIGRKELARVLRVALFSSTIYMAPIFISMFYAEHIFTAFGQSTGVPQAADFFAGYAPFLPFFPIRMVLECLGLGANKQKGMAFIAEFSLLASAGLAYRFSFVHKQGFLGLGRAMGIGSALTCGGFFSYLALSLREHGLFKRIFVLPITQDDGRIFKHQAHSASSWVLANASDVTAGFFYVLMAHITNSLPLQSVATQYSQWFFILNLALASRAGISVSQAYGELDQGGQYREVRDTAYSSLMAAALVGSVAAIFISIYPEALITPLLGTPNEQTMNILRTMLAITGVAAGVDAIRSTGLSIFRARKHLLKPALISSGGLWLGVLIAWPLAKYSQLGASSIPFAYLAGTILGTVPLPVLGKMLVDPIQLAKEKGVALTLYKFSRGEMEDNPSIPLLGERSRDAVVENTEAHVA